MGRVGDSMEKRFMRKALSSILLTVLLLCLGACQKQAPEPSFPAVRYLYAGSQEGNGFQMWIWIHEDESIPALVHSGLCRYIDDKYVETDIEKLDCRFTDEGFTLSDPVTGEVLYTATNLDKPGFPSGYYVHVTWTHSPGATWDAFAEERGWQREITLWVQMDEGDDMLI